MSKLSKFDIFFKILALALAVLLVCIITISYFILNPKPIKTKAEKQEVEMPVLESEPLLPASSSEPVFTFVAYSPKYAPVARLFAVNGGTVEKYYDKHGDSIDLNEYIRQLEFSIHDRAAYDARLNAARVRFYKNNEGFNLKN